MLSVTFYEISVIDINKWKLKHESAVNQLLFVLLTCKKNFRALSILQGCAPQIG